MEPEPSVKRQTRMIVQANVSTGNTLQQVKSSVRKVFGYQFLSSSLEEYIDYKFFKYSINQLCCDLEASKPFSSTAATFTSTSTSLQAVIDLLDEVRNASQFDEFISPVITSNSHFKTVSEAEFSSDQKQQEVFRLLKYHLLDVTIKLGNTLKLEYELEDAQRLRVPPSGRLEMRLLDYLTDYKTQFLVELDPFLILRSYDGDYHEWSTTEIEKYGHVFDDHIYDVLFGKNSAANERHVETAFELELELREFTSEQKLGFAQQWEGVIQDRFRCQVGIQVTKHRDNDTHFLVVSKPVIVLSQCLQEVEQYLRNSDGDDDNQESIYIPKIDQVDFAASNVFYVDTHLDNVVWHGRVISVTSPLIWCVGKDLCWNVSGRHGRPGSNETSINGTDGENGESGGNVTFLAKDYRGMGQLKIVSNGGNGGRGGDGRNGDPGKDGVGMSLQTLKERFPSPVKFLGSDAERCVQIVRNLRTDTVPREETQSQFVGFDKDGTKTNPGFFFPSRSLHLKGRLKDDLEFEFSFFEKTPTSHTYLLIKGTQATLGLPGGTGARGGAAGHPGKIEILNETGQRFNLSEELKPATLHLLGYPGEHGKDGEPGKPGTHGQDVGFVDVWGWTVTAFYEKEKFRLVNRTGPEKLPGTGSQVWCSFSNAYRSIESYNEDYLIPQVLDQEEERRQNLVVQKKNAIDVEKLCETFSNLQRDSVSTNSFRKSSSDLHLLGAWEMASTTATGIDNETEVTNIKKVEIKSVRSPDHSMTSVVRRRGRKFTKSKSHSTGFNDNAKGQAKDCIEIDLKLGPPRILEKLRKISGVEEIMLGNEQFQDTCFKVDHFLLEQRSILQDYMASEQTKESFEKVTSPGGSGSDSALHVIFGEIDNATKTFSLSGVSPGEMRMTVSKKIFKWLRSQMCFDQETRDALKLSLTSLIHGRSHGFNKQIVEANIGSKLKLFLAQFEAAPEEVSWNLLDHDPFREAVMEYPNVLKSSQVSYLMSDLVLISKSFGVKIHFFYDVPSEPVRAQFPLDSRQMPQPICQDIRVQVCKKSSEKVFLTMDANGSYLRVLRRVERDTDLIQQIFNTTLDFFPARDGAPTGHEVKLRFQQIICDLLFEPYSDDLDYYSKLMTIWSLPLIQLFLHTISKARRDDLPCAKMMFQQITHAFITSNREEVVSIASILLAFPEEGADWVREMCLLRIQILYGFSKSTGWYRKTLQRFTCSLLIHLVEFLRCSFIAGEFHPSESDSEVKFRKFLDTLLEKYGPFEDTSDYSCLQGMNCSDLWYHQLSKLRVNALLKALPAEVWQNYGSNNKKAFSEAFYYFYHLFDSKPARATEILTLYSTAIQREIYLSFGEKEKRKSASLTFNTILAKLHSGIWTLSDDIIEQLASCRRGLPGWEAILDNKNDSEGGKVITTGGAIGQIMKRDEITTLEYTTVDKLVNWNEKLEEEDPESKWSLRIIRTGRREKKKIFKKSKDEFKKIIDDWLKEFNKNVGNGKKVKTQEEMENLTCDAIKMVDNVIEYFIGHRLRHTQKISVLGALLVPKAKSSDNERKNLLAQVRTGEGKSLIVLTIAVIRGLFGKKTDIVTSSKVLAERDAKDYREIFAAFKLTVGHVTMDNPKERAREYQKTVVYGEVADFQRDYLIDHFYFYDQNIRGARDFSFIIIDEVDSMLLDKGNSVLYLSHTPAGLDTLEHILLFIWNSVVHGVNNNEFKPLLIHDKVLKGISTTNEDDLDVEEDRLDFHCPRYLQEFVKLHLFTWIKSAYHATQLRENVHYSVGLDQFGKNKSPKVVIMDLDTGTDLKECQWSDALHQFLQLKHGCRLTSMSLKAVFISNISFFNMYSNIFGLTGTLGGLADRKFLQKTYETDLMIVPTALPRRFTEEQPLLCPTNTKRLQNLSSDACEKIALGRSVLVLCESVKDAESVFTFFCDQKESVVDREKILLYRRDFEPFPVTANDKSLEKGTLIIATNLAGRGTDIKLSDELKKNGGLHVIFGYLPGSARVLWQGYGRSARCGDQGSGRVIFFVKMDAAQQEPPTAIDFMIEQGQVEMNRVAEIRTYYDNVVFPEEKLFEAFCKRFDDFGRKIDQAYQTYFDKQVDDNIEKLRRLEGHVDKVKELVKFSMLNEWAFWLDRKSTNLKNLSSILPVGGKYEFYRKESEQLQKEFDLMISRYEEVTAEYEKVKTSFIYKIGLQARPQIEEHATKLIHEPAILIKLAKCYISRKEIKPALEFLEKVKESETDESSLFHVIALYYEIMCGIKQHKIWDTSFVQKVRRTIDKLDNLANLQMGIAFAIEHYRVVGGQQIDVFSHDGDEGLHRQKQICAGILLDFRQSLENFLGKEGIEAGDFADILSGHADSAEILLKELLENGRISMPRFATVDPDSSSSIEMLSAIYGLPFDEILSILKNHDDHQVTPEVVKELKRELGLPSKEGFWEEIKSCLEDVIKITVKKPVAAEDSNDNLALVKNNLRPEVTSKSKYFLTLNNSNLAKEKLIGFNSEHQCDPEFRHLERGSHAWRDTLAFVNKEKLANLELQKYAKIDDVEKLADLLNVDADLVEEIMDNLRSKDIINDQGMPTTFNFKISFEDISSAADPDRFTSSDQLRSLESDVERVIRNRCCYQLQRLRLLQEMNSHDKEQEEDNWRQLQILDLPNNPTARFIMDAIRLRLIENSKVLPKNVKSWTVRVSETTQNLLRSMQNMNDNNEGRHSLDQGQELPGKGLPILTRDDIRLIYPESENGFVEKIYKQLINSGWISGRDGSILVRLDIFGHIDQQKTPVTHANEITKYSFQDVIPVIRLRLLQANENFEKKVDERLEELRGARYTLGEPDAVLESLFLQEDPTFTSSLPKGASHLTEPEYQQEMARFALCGMEHIICPTEQAYSPRMIASTCSVLILGVAQTVGGYLLMRCQNYLQYGTALVASGLQDIVFSIYCFKTGCFSWAQWAKVKSCYLAFLLAMKMRSMWRSVFRRTREVSGHLMSMVPSVPQILTDYVQRQATDRVLPHVERIVDVVVQKVSSAICKIVTQRIERHQGLEDALLLLASGVGARAATEMFRKCHVKAAEQVLGDQSTTRVFAATTKTIIKDYLKPALKPLRSGGGTIFGNSNWMEVVNALITLLEGNVDTLLETAGVVHGVATLANETERLVKTEFDTWRRMVEYDGEGNHHPVVLTPLTDEREKNNFLKECRRQIIEGVNRLFGVVVSNNVRTPLMQEGMKKVMRYANLSSMETRRLVAADSHDHQINRHLYGNGDNETEDADDVAAKFALEIFKAEQELEERKMSTAEE